MKKWTALILCIAVMLSVAIMPASAESTAYRTLYSGEFTSLNYLTTATTTEFAMAANVIDTLVEYDKYGQVQPSLAESWTYDEESLTYTFKLREDATWVRADGSEYAKVTAHDFVTSAKYILDAAHASSTANIFYSVIEGAEAYYLGTTTPEAGKEPYPVMDFETVGVKALDDYTLQYTLVEPVPYFLSMTTYVCFMPVNAQFLEEKGAEFGVATSNDNILYNGAYVLSTFEPQQKRVYTKNAANWDAENILIETIEQTYNKEATTISPELYKRGDIDQADIDSTIASEWLADETTADLIHPLRQSGFYSYFYAFNFDPHFDAVYEPENWKLAVNNENFRLSIATGMDRMKAMLITDPDNPDALLFNTVTPPEFVSINGLDYTEMGALAEITEKGEDTFDEALALEYKAKAVEELTAAGATFPVKVLMCYNPSTAGWAEECVVLEQQLEGLLGTDYIDVIVEAGPSSGFLGEVRRGGKYAILKCNWGPDYADPNTYTDPFYEGSYNWPELATEYNDENGRSIYYNLVDAARDITDDLTARYDAFAEAEAFLINKAFIIPFGHGTGGYTASRLNPFESQFAPFGISRDRYKGQSVMEKPMNTDEYFEAYDQWEEERAALAGQ